MYTVNPKNFIRFFFFQSVCLYLEIVQNRLTTNKIKFCNNKRLIYILEIELYIILYTIFFNKIYIYIHIY